MLMLELDRTEEQALGALAEQQGKPLNQLLSEVVRDYLEDMHDASLADAAIERLARGESTTTSLEEVKRKLGIA